MKKRLHQKTDDEERRCVRVGKYFSVQKKIVIYQVEMENQIKGMICSPEERRLGEEVCAGGRACRLLLNSTRLRSETGDAGSPRGRVLKKVDKWIGYGWNLVG